MTYLDFVFRTTQFSVFLKFFVSVRHIVALDARIAFCLLFALQHYYFFCEGSVHSLFGSMVVWTSLGRYPEAERDVVEPMYNRVF